MKAHTALKGPPLGPSLLSSLTPVSQPSLSENQLLVVIGQLRSETSALMLPSGPEVTAQTTGFESFLCQSVPKFILPTKLQGHPNQPYTERQRASSWEITRQTHIEDLQGRDSCPGNNWKAGGSAGLEVWKSKVLLKPNEGCLLQSRKLNEQGPAAKIFLKEEEKKKPPLLKFLGVI